MRKVAVPQALFKNKIRGPMDPDTRPTPRTTTNLAAESAGMEGSVDGFRKDLSHEQWEAVDDYHTPTAEELDWARGALTDPMGFVDIEPSDEIVAAAARIYHVVGEGFMPREHKAPEHVDFMWISLKAHEVCGAQPSILLWSGAASRVLSPEAEARLLEAFDLK